MVTVQVEVPPELAGTANGTGMTITGRVMTVGTVVVTVVGTEVTVVGGGTTVVVVETVAGGTVVDGVVSRGGIKAQKAGKTWHSSFKMRATRA
jgi:hypothetical protein